MVNDLLKRMPTQLKLVFSLFSRITYTSINDFSLYFNLLSFTLIVNDTLAGKKKKTSGNVYIFLRGKQSKDVISITIMMPKI